MMAVAYVDGGSRPTNPGHAGFAVVITLYPAGGEHILSRYIGWKTNNVAEYFALITAIKYAKALGAQELEIRSDSKLVVEQVHGRWRVRADELQLLNREARWRLSQQFPSAWSLDWVPREENIQADQICTDAICAGRFRNPWVRRHLKGKDKNPGKIIDPFSV